MIRRSVLSVVCALALMGCGKEPTPSAAQEALNNNDPAAALKILRAPLAATPEDVVLNTLAVQAYLRQCIKENCFANPENPTFAALNNHRRFATKPTTLNDAPVSVLLTAQETAQDLIALPNQPHTTLKALQHTPEYARMPYKMALAHQAKVALSSQQTETARTLLPALAREDVFSRGTRHLAGYLFSTLNGKTTSAKANIVALKANKGGAIAPLWGAVPYVWPTDVLLERYDAADWLALADEDGRYVLANSLQNIAETSDTVLKLSLLTRALELNPENEALWATYLPQMKAYLLETGDVALLARINPLDVPAGIRVGYNTMLFELVAPFNAQNRDGLPLLQQIALPQMPKPSQVRLEKLLRAGLESALNSNNMPLILAYTAYRPSVAQTMRRDIVPVVVDAIKAEFNVNQFDKVVAYGDYLHKDLELDFDLNALLTQVYAAHIKTSKVSDALSADAPDWLLKNEPYNLGAKFAFMQTRFAEKPMVLDNQLKDIIASADGIYGTPTAFYRLMHLFNDTDFPQVEQLTYLRAAIQSSLEDDQDLSALGFAGIGHKLYLKHDISLNFVASEALQRTNNLEDELALWAATPPELHDAWQTVQPAFYTLMRAITAFDGGDKAQAATLFNQISSPYYLEQAAPYLAHYATTVDKALGWYVPLDSTTDHPLGFIGISPSGAGQLTNLTLTLINRVGTLRHDNPQTLTENYAAVYRAQLPTTLDFDTETLDVSDVEKSQIVLPNAFERVYGDITKLKMAKNSSGGQLLKVYTAGRSSPQTFLRVSDLGHVALFPEGRYRIQHQLSTPNTSTDGILPPKSVLTLTTKTTEPLQPTSNGQNVGSVVYPVGGKLTHPFGTQPIKVSGFYSPQKHLLDLTFNYPLSADGRQAKGVVRCQQLGRSLVCAGHNAHSNRQQYTAVTHGLLDYADWKNWQKAQTALVTDIKERMAKEAEAKKAVAKTSDTVSSTSVSATTVEEAAE